jgi:4-hydroxy-tetrahydrodipicolinate reductase
MKSSGGGGGAGGKMGQALIEAVLADNRCSRRGAGREGSPGRRNIGGVKVGADVGKAAAAGDVLIDFTAPKGPSRTRMPARARQVHRHRHHRDPRFAQAILQAGRRIPIALSPNFAVGVNAVFKLAEVAAGILGDDYDVEIVEAHHRHKVDAPSGTALKLGEIIATSLKRDLKKVARHGREGDTGARPGRQIGFTPSAAAIVGEHTVIFAGTGERVEVSSAREPAHLCPGRAARRQVPARQARGAVRHERRAWPEVAGAV